MRSRKPAASPSPASRYDEPAQIVRDRSLPHQVKLALLQEWHEDLIAVQRADSEGMSAPAFITSGSRQLQAIEDAIRALEGEIKSSAGPVTAGAPAAAPTAPARTAFMAKRLADAARGERALAVSFLLLSVAALLVVLAALGLLGR